MHVSSRKRSLLAAGFAITLLAGLPALAQNTPADPSVHPITSLPKAPNDPTRAVPAPIVLPPAPTPAAPASAPVPTVEAAPVPVPSPAAAPPEPAPAPPQPVQAPAAPLIATVAAPVPAARPQRRPVHFLSTVAIEAAAGSGGFGAQIAVPLSRTTNLRAGADVFGYTSEFTEDGLHISGDLKFRSANVNLDWFPFGGGFHISPGLTLYNGNNLNATVQVPGGQTFSLGDVDYTSLATDPIHGVASLTFGKRTAPQLTVGWGNMIPRSGRHFSVPFDIGFQYLGAPSIRFNLAGTGCSDQGCSNLATDPTAQANMRQEESDLNGDIAPLRFYPIARIGVAYKF